MLSDFLQQLQQPLLHMGYVAGIETSLQVAEGREPDLYIRLGDKTLPLLTRAKYELAAAELLAEAGVSVEAETDLMALFIVEARTGDLVTIVEIISPNNKTKDHEMTAYRGRREQLIQRGVNVTELDMTRSVKRLVNNTMTHDHPYHVAIFLPGEYVRVVGVSFDQRLSRLALPLRDNAIALELHHAYQNAYRRITTAWHIHHEENYTEEFLPFPSLLNEQQMRDALYAARIWQEELHRLRND